MSLIKNPSRILSRSSADPYPGVRRVTVAVDFYRIAVVARSYHRGTLHFKFFLAREIVGEGTLSSRRAFRLLFEMIVYQRFLESI